MFNYSPPFRKHAPPVTDCSPSALEPLHTSDTTWPPPGAKMRISKGAVVVRGVRRQPSPQAASLESLEAVWGRREPAEVTPRSPGAREAAKNGIEGHGGGPPRTRKSRFRAPDVRTIFSPGEKDPRVKEESGEGHTFEAGGENTWCDVCCQYIFQGVLTCAGCKYACHAECRDRVSLDCHPASSPVSQDQLNNNTPLHLGGLVHEQYGVKTLLTGGNAVLEDVAKERESRSELSREEIKQRIEQYNSLTRDYLKMTLNPTSVYTGFIKVTMDLRRPVTVRGGPKGAVGTVTQEAFYLPRGVNNTLHISSENTVKQVIVALLNKFTVADNPAKYALYKRYRREEQVYVCKLADGEKPLFLRLVAGPDSNMLGFVLREQQSGEVMWDAFSIPELRNFLRILDKEEEEQKEAIARRYLSYRRRLEEALRELRGPP